MPHAHGKPSHFGSSIVHPPAGAQRTHDTVSIVAPGGNVNAAKRCRDVTTGLTLAVAVPSVRLKLESVDRWQRNVMPMKPSAALAGY